MGLMDVLRGMQYGPHGAPRGGSSGSSSTGTDSSGGAGTTSGGSGTGTGSGGSGTGMSPIAMAILGLLAYKAIKSMTHHEPAPAGGPSPGAGNGHSGNGHSGNGHSGSLAGRDTVPRNTSSGSDMGTAPRDSDMGRGWGGGLGDLGPGSRGTGSSTQGGGGTQTQTSSGSQGGTGADSGGGPSSIGDLIKGALGTLLAGGAAGGVMSGGLNDLLKQMQKQGFTDHADSWTGAGPNKPIPPGDLAKVLGPDQIESMMAQSGLSREELLEGLSKHLPEVVNRLTPDGQVPHHL